MNLQNNIIVALLSLALVGCDLDDDAGSGSPGSTTPTAAPATEQRATLLAVTEQDELLLFRSDRPAQIFSRATLGGVIADDSANPPFAVAMDLRPATGQIYILYSDGRLYTATPSSAQLELVGRIGFGGALPTAMDFNPNTDELRVLSENGGNRRVSPDDAALLSVDTALAFAAGDPNAAATPQASGLTYALDANGRATAFVSDNFSDDLATLGSPGGDPHTAATGRLFTVGNASADRLVETSSLDAGEGRHKAYTFNFNGDDPVLLEIDLTSTLVTTLGRIGDGSGRLGLLALAVVQLEDVPPGGGQATPTPIATATPSPTAAPSPAPTASPSPSITPMPSATPEPSPTPTPVMAPGGTLSGDQFCTAIAGGDGVVAALTEGLTCLACTGESPENLIDADPNNAAVIDLTLGLLFGEVVADIDAPPGILYPGGRIVGAKLRFVPAGSQGVGDLQILPDLTITTSLIEGETVTVQDTATLDTSFGLRGDFMEFVESGEPFFLGLQTDAAKPFNRLTIAPSVGVLGLASVVELFYGCVDAPGEGGVVLPFEPPF